MNRWRELPAWTLRAWPVLALLPVFAIHWIAHQECPGSSQLVNKVVGMILQLSGGLLILYSINDNLGLFRRQSLLATAVAWFRSFPLTRKSVTVSLRGVAAAAMAGSLTATVSRGATTIEERLKRLEEELQAVRRELQAGLAGAQQRLAQVKSDLTTQLQTTTTQVTELSQKVERAAVGGFKAQAFGVLLAIYGAITSVFA